MTPTELARASLIKFHGADSEFMYFHTPSWTDPKSDGYDITVDKSTGEVRCTCMDCVGRRKRADISNPAFPGACKHVRDGLGPMLRTILNVDQDTYQKVKAGLTK